MNAKRTIGIVAAVIAVVCLASFHALVAQVPVPPEKPRMPERPEIPDLTVTDFVIQGHLGQEIFGQVEYPFEVTIRNERDAEINDYFAFSIQQKSTFDSDFIDDNDNCYIVGKLKDKKKFKYIGRLSLDAAKVKNRTLQLRVWVNSGCYNIIDPQPSLKVFEVRRDNNYSNVLRVKYVAPYAEK